MLKVECESCKAPYQVDERRVPPTGLKMRCPKCGHTFKVTNPNAPAVAAAGAPAKRAPQPQLTAPAPPQAAPPPPARIPPTAQPPSAASSSGRRAPTIAGMGYGTPSAPAPLPALPDADDDPFAELPAPKIPVAAGAAGRGPAPRGPQAGPSPTQQPPPFGSPAPRAGLPGLPSPDDFGDIGGGFGAVDDPLGGFGSLDDLPMPATLETGAGLPSLAAPRAPFLQTQRSADSIPIGPPDRLLPAAPQRQPQPPPPAFAPPPVRPPAATRDFGADFGALPDLPSPMRPRQSAPPVAAPAAFGDLGFGDALGDDDDLGGGVGGSVSLGGGGRRGAGAGGFGALDDDLPMRAAELPAARRPAAADLPMMRQAPPVPPPRPVAAPAVRAGGFGEIDLPSVSGQLPAVQQGGNRDLPAAMDPERLMPAHARRGGGGGAGRPFSPFDDLPSPQMPDLPIVQSALPALQSSLPVVQSSLPAVQSSLPVVQGSLPALQGSLPALQGSLPALQGSLPALQGSLPALTDAFPALADALPMPQNALPAARFDSFGEFELPKEGSRSSSGPPGANSVPPAIGGGGSGEHARVSGGVGFGEVDLGASDDDDDLGPSIGTEEPIRAAFKPTISSAGMPGIGTEVAIGGGQTDKQRRRAQTVVIRRSSNKGPRVLAALGVLLLVGGAALQATSAGAFGYKIVSDTLHTKDYENLMQSAASSARRRMGLDTWADFRGAVDDLAAAHAASPRARDLTSYAALAAYEGELRFGPDGPTDARAKGWLAELGDKDARYSAVARAVGLAAGGDLDKARAGLDRAPITTDDAVNQDIALSRGELELAAKQPAAAIVAFGKAATLAPSARAQFGLARAYYAASDLKNARAAVASALTFNKSDAGALLLRATMAWRSDHDGDAAIADLTTILDGAAASSASQIELSQGHALRGYIAFRREHSADARAHFDEALKLNSRNVLALVGQGELLLADQRATEALARFDTALGADPTDIDAIVGDANANIALEKLTEAKKMLADARAKYPKSMRLALTAGRTEAALGNKTVAEQTLKDAIALNDPADPLAIQPYLALAELLAGENKVEQAQAVLDEARSKLPDSLEMQRALGDVASAQGRFDQAVAHYQAALTKDPKDLQTHFRYGITLRKMGKADDATAELDQVAAGDKEFPGLALQRGLLFEETGQPERALDMFQNALKTAPNDPDLQLRVGAAYVASGRPDDGIAILKKVMELRPNSAEANHYMGRAFMAKGPLHASEAAKYLRHAVDLDPNRAEYHLYIAWQVNDSENPELGIVRAEIDKALALDATLADAYWQRGVLERKTIRIDDAIKDLKHALELKPTRYQAHAWLAECYEDKNQDAAALGEWQKAVAGDDEIPYWRYKLGKQKMQHGGAGAADDLLYAADAAEKLTAHPGWLADAEYLAASASQKAGKKTEAIAHYGTFLGMAPLTSPDRKDAIRQLSALGAPWTE